MTRCADRQRPASPAVHSLLILGLDTRDLRTLAVQSSIMRAPVAPLSSRFK